MSLVDKFKTLMFGGEEDEEDYEYEEVETKPRLVEREVRREKDTFRPEKKNYMQSVAQAQAQQGVHAPQSSFNQNQKVVSLNTSMQLQVVINIPECFEDARAICDCIKENKPVIVNLEKLELPVAQRLMDFLSGGCYCVSGTIQRVANNIFIVAPINVDLSGDFKEELKQKGILLPWGSQRQ